MKSFKVAGALVVILLLAGCMANPNPQIGIQMADGSVAGFWLGLWHGMISGIAFIVSLFNDNVNIYEVHNNGGWYNLGFVLGAGMLGGGSSSASSSRRRGR